MKYALVLVPGLILLMLPPLGFNYWAWHWWNKWTVVVAVFSIVYSFIFAKRTSFFFLPLTLTLLLSSVWLGIYNFNQYIFNVDHELFLALNKGALYAFVTVLIVSLTLMWLPKGLKKPVELYLGLVCILSSLLTIAQYRLPAYNRGAFTGNASMNAVLVACLMPFGLTLHWGLFLPVLSVSLWSSILTHSSIGIGVSLLVLAVHLMRISKASFLWMLLGGIIALLPLVAVLMFLPYEWASSSGRVAVWKVVFQWWNAHAPVLFGAGLGSNLELVPHIQDEMHVEKAGYFIWLHSDWLQVLWETGVVGFTSTLTAFTYLAWKSWYTPYLFASLIGFGAAAVADYPCRLPIHATAITLLVWLILNQKGESHGDPK